MFERHVDLNGRMAGNRSRNASPNLVEVQGLVFARKLVEQLVQHVLHLARFEAGRGNLDGNAAGAKGLCLKAIFLQLVRNFREYGLLRRSQFDHDRHQQALAFNLLLRALF